MGNKSPSNNRPLTGSLWSTLRAFGVGQGKKTKKTRAEPKTFYGGSPKHYSKPINLREKHSNRGVGTWGHVNFLEKNRYR